MGVSILISVETWFLWCLGFDCNASIQPPSWRFFVWCFRSATQQFAEVFSSCTSMVTDDQYKRLHVWKIVVAKHVKKLRCSNGLVACDFVWKFYSFTCFFFGQRFFDIQAICGRRGASATGAWGWWKPRGDDPIWRAHNCPKFELLNFQLIVNICQYYLLQVICRFFMIFLQYVDEKYVTQLQIRRVVYYMSFLQMILIGNKPQSHVAPIGPYKVYELIYSCSIFQIDVQLFKKLWKSL